MLGGIARSEDERGPAARPVVLHVDDDPVIRDLAVELLQRTGIVVTSESDPHEVPVRVAEAPVDAVVSDYEMPGMDGGTLFTRLRERYPELPFVAFTGRDRSAMPPAFESAARTWYVKKGGREGFDRLREVVGEAVSTAEPATPVPEPER